MAAGVWLPRPVEDSTAYRRWLALREVGACGVGQCRHLVFSWGTTPPGRRGAGFLGAGGRKGSSRRRRLSGGNVRAGTRYFVSDNGVRYAVHDDDAAHDLGMPDAMIAAPWPLLAKLPAGPELSRSNASVAQDVPAATRSDLGSS